MSSAPYTIESPELKHAIIRFAEICDHTRTTVHERELSGLIEANSHVACDLSQTQAMTADWFRWLGRLMLKAQKLNKTFVLVGASESLLETADVLDLKRKFQYAQTINVIS